MKPCGCAKSNPFDCAEDQYATGLRKPMFACATEMCDCVCHDQNKRRAKRLKLKPVTEIIK